MPLNMDAIRADSEAVKKVCPHPEAVKKTHVSYVATDGIDRDFFLPDEHAKEIRGLCSEEIIDAEHVAELASILDALTVLDDRLCIMAYAEPRGEGCPKNKTEIGVDLYECYIGLQISNAQATLALLISNARPTEEEVDTAIMQAMQVMQVMQATEV